jgi:hypothetical protein
MMTHKERANLILSGVKTISLIASLSKDGLTREEVTIIVQTLYDLAHKISEAYKDV